MFEWSIKVKDKTIAYDKRKKEIEVFNTTKNIEDILETNNNIEELRKIMIKNKTNLLAAKNEMIFNNKTLKNVNILFILGFLFSIGISLPLSTIIIIICIILNIPLNINKIKLEKKLEYLESQNEIIQKMLTVENEKLVTLQKNDKIIESDEITEKKSINRSDKINNLYNKLKLIKYYTENKSKLEKLFNEGILFNKLEKEFSLEDIVFLEILVIENSSLKELRKTNQKIKYKK